MMNHHLPRLPIGESCNSPVKQEFDREQEKKRKRKLKIYLILATLKV